MLTAVRTRVPPRIAGRDLVIRSSLTAACERALVALAAADASAEGASAALSRFLIRSESVASSKIERIHASAEDFARALAGSRANRSATSMAAASAALYELVQIVGTGGVFRLDDILSAHRALMADDPAEADFAGRIRDMQNWVGGSDHSPRNALYVPPPPDLVPALLEDLVAYLDRDDVPALVQAAIAHAQFESIHPFTDGNGRIGRAIVSASLRRRRITVNTVTPLASGILAQREEYFEALGAYREGDPVPIIALFARAALVAAREMRVSIHRLRGFPRAWAAEAHARKGTLLESLAFAFFDQPVMRASDMEHVAGGGTAQTYVAVEQLERAGVVREITGRKRDRVWVAVDLLGELDDLDARIQSGMRSSTA